MGWTSLFGGGDSNWNLFGGGKFGGSDGNWGGGFDWGSVWGDIGQSGGTISNLLKGIGGSSGGSSSGGLLNTIGNLFGGGSGGGGGSSGGMGNLFGALLSGLGGAAQAWMDEDMVKEAGKQQRQTRAFEADLADYYKQKDIYRNRRALDAYGQFSLLGKYAPTYSGDPAVEVPTKPRP